MENLRISERNSIKQQRREFESYAQHDLETINRLRQSTTNVMFNITKIKTLKESVTKFEEELVKIDERLAKLSAGELDTELRQTMKKTTKIAKLKSIATRQKKLAEIEDKKQRSVISKKYWDATLKAGRSQRYADRSSIRGYGYVCRVSSQIPPYLKTNLKKMPNNKGYVWRGVQFFGLLNPDKSGVYYLYENKKGEALTHEWRNEFTDYKLIYKNKMKERFLRMTRKYKKQPSGPKKLIDEKIYPNGGKRLKNNQRKSYSKNSNSNYNRRSNRIRMTQGFSRPNRKTNQKTNINPPKKVTNVWTNVKKKKKNEISPNPNPNPNPNPKKLTSDWTTVTTKKKKKTNSRQNNKHHRIGGGRGGRSGRSGRGGRGSRGGRGGRGGRGRGRDRSRN
jgi:uncharacterized membrane protein YgcG